MSKPRGTSTYSLIGGRTENEESEVDIELVCEEPIARLVQEQNDESVIIEEECDGDLTTKNVKEKNEEMMFQVLAPCNMEAGFEFVVQVDRKTAFVQVPSAGVSQGQLFSPIIIRVVDHATYPFAYPVAGRWSDSIFGCFNDSSWMFAFLCGLFFLPQFLARVIFRIEYTRQTFSPKWLCWTVSYFMFYFIANILLTLAPGATAAMAFLVQLIVIILLELYFFAQTYQTRGNVRKKFAIPGDNFTDCCLAFWCRCCVILQMYRHTKLMRGGEKPGKMSAEYIHCNSDAHIV